MSPIPFPLLGREMNEHKSLTIGRNTIDCYPPNHLLVIKVDVCVKAEEEDRFFVELCDTNTKFTYVIISYTEKNSLYPCTRNQLCCLVRTGANCSILDEMTKFKFSKKNKESKLIWRTDPFRCMY